MRRLLLLLATMATLTACADTVVDPGEEPSANEVAFSVDILPALTASCAGSNCHVGATTSGVNLSNWSQVTGSVGSQYGGPIVLAGNGAGSPLVNKLSASPQFGTRMPIGGAPIDAAVLQAIRDWIDEGAPNN